MISGISPSGIDPATNILNNMIKNITDAQMDLTERLLKVSVAETVEASQVGLGENIDILA